MSIESVLTHRGYVQYVDTYSGRVHVRVYFYVYMYVMSIFAVLDETVLFVPATAVHPLRSLTKIPPPVALYASLGAVPLPPCRRFLPLHSGILGVLRLLHVSR